MKKKMKNCSLFISLLLAMTLLITGCFETQISNTGNLSDLTSGAEAGQSFPDETEKGSFDYASVEPYSGKPYAEVHSNIPYFTREEQTSQSFELYEELDALGRCTKAMASVGRDLMPTEDRESISHIKPTGWHSVQYDTVDGKSLYNRCHLIGFQLCGENANEKNLITGTRYMNVQGMLPFENMVADYVKETGHHVLYRVTPVFVGNELVARGVLMEGYSVEDAGEGITFCVFCYNVQPQIHIDYATGESFYDPDSSDVPDDDTEGTYILNLKSKKFHLADCPGVATMKEENKQVFKGSRAELIRMGYEPCKSCNP